MTWNLKSVYINIQTGLGLFPHWTFDKQQMVAIKQNYALQREGESPESCLEASLDFTTKMSGRGSRGPGKPCVRPSPELRAGLPHLLVKTATRPPLGLGTLQDDPNMESRRGES